MIDELIAEYIACAQSTTLVDYSDKKSVRRYNAASDRMRAIVSEVVTLEQDALNRFISVLQEEPASLWAAHHLVELAELDPATLSRCFERVERAKLEAQAESRPADAMGEEIWLKKMKVKKGIL